MLAGVPFGLGPFELILILAVVIIIFGVGRLPEVGGAVGRSIREFRKASKEQGEIPEETESGDTAAGAAQAAQRVCTKCGAQLAAESKFCAECGTPGQAAVN